LTVSTKPMKKVFDLFTKKKTLIIIVWLFLISLGLRAIRIDHYVSYHQDQVRDLYFVKDSLSKNIPILLGPKASVGDFFLPPFWYYLMGAAYIFSPSPIAPALMTAILCSLTTIFVFLFGKKIFTEHIAFATALLYAVSPLSIEYSRFAWNPNPIPLFVILMLYFLYEYVFEKKELAFWLGAISANLALQLHYQGMVVFAFFFLALLFYKKMSWKKFGQYVLVNLLLLSPFIVYELLNNCKNTNGIINFLISSQGESKLKYLGIPFYIKFIINDFSYFLSRVMFFKSRLFGYLALGTILLSLLWEMVKFKKIRQKELPIFLFIFFSLAMLFIYKNSLIDFYLLFLIPVVVIYFAREIVWLIGEKITIMVLFILILVNLIYSPAFGKFDKTYLWIRESIKQITTVKNYCLAYNIFPQNYIESKYRYMMTLAKNQPVYQNCELPMYYRCDPKVKTGFYICEGVLCPKKPVDLKKAHLVDMKPLDSDVKIYKISF